MQSENEFRYDRRTGPRDRTLRVGDREREAVADILRAHHLEGRLDTAEFQERLKRCLEAKTYAELDRLIADFPSPEAERRRPGQAGVWSWWRIAPLPLIPLALIAAIVLGGGHFAWLVFPLFLLFVVRPFLWRPWAGGSRYGPWGCGPPTSTRGDPRI